MKAKDEVTLTTVVHRRSGSFGDCPLCHRSTALTFHHLIPKKMHRRTFFQKNYKRSELSGGIYICRQCHNGIHQLFDEMTLAKQLNSLESLRLNESLIKHCQWVSRQRI